MRRASAPSRTPGMRSPTSACPASAWTRRTLRDCLRRATARLSTLPCWRWTSGESALADAWHAFADICLSGVGLDPAYVAGLLEAGDSAAQHASLLAMVHKRFGVVYAAVQEWISAGRQLPHKARDFLTGEAA